MRYLDTAFKQLEFAIKLMNSAERGVLKVGPSISGRLDPGMPKTTSQSPSARPPLLSIPDPKCICARLFEPRWKFRNPRFARVYTIGRVKVDLSGLDERLFEYSHIGGPDVLFTIKGIRYEPRLREPRLTKR